MQRHTLYQLSGLGLFLVGAVVAFVLSPTFGVDYMIGLVFGFAIGLTVAVFQYGVIVEAESRTRGYKTTVAQKIDNVFE
jgi:hypothetical protein